MTDKGNTYKAWVKGVFPAAYVEKLGSMYCICKFTFMQDSPLDNYDICDVSANMVWKRAWALIDDLPPQTEQPEELAELRRKAAAFDWIEQNCHYIEAYDSTDWWWNKEVDGGLLKAIEQAKDGG